MSFLKVKGTNDHLLHPSLPPRRHLQQQPPTTTTSHHRRPPPPLVTAGSDGSLSPEAMGVMGDDGSVVVTEKLFSSGSAVVVTGDGSSLPPEAEVEWRKRKELHRRVDLNISVVLIWSAVAGGGVVVLEVAAVGGVDWWWWSAVAGGDSGGGWRWRRGGVVGEEDGHLSS